MNKLWDDLKDNMKEWGVSAVEKAEEISRVAVAKGEEFTKISKLKFDILQLQKDKSSDLFAFSRCIARILKNYIKDGEIPSDKICPECNHDSLSYQDGCISCLNCGYTECS